MNKIIGKKLPGGIIWLCACMTAFGFPAENLSAQVAACNKPGAVFCSGFEENNWRSVWDDYDGNPDTTNHLMLDPGPFNVQGNHVLRLRVPPGRGGADLAKVLPQTYDKMYARWYEFWEPGYNFAAPNHGSGLFAGDRNYLGQSDNRPTGSDFVQSWFEPDKGRAYLYTYYRGMYMDCANPIGSCWGDHFPCFLDSGQNYCTDPSARPKPGKLPPILTTGKWYCIEQMIDLGAPTATGTGANGILDFWIDGVEYGPWTGLWFRTTPALKLSILWLNLFHHDATHSVQGVYLDDVAVSAGPIGPGTANGIRTVDNDKKEPGPSPVILVSTKKIRINALPGKNITVSMYNAKGNVIMHGKKVPNMVTLDISHLPGGTYLVNVETDKVNSVRKIVVRH